MNRRRRLDVELVRRGLVATRTEAKHAIDAGRVTVAGAPALKPATQVLPSDALVLLSPPRRYVSRGGEKLDAGLHAFRVDPSGRRCLDIGSSTGGFTDCLLHHGAAHVVAVDVGYGQLAERLRRDERVTVVERTNARGLTPSDVPGPPAELVVADVSFISLTLVLPAVRRVVATDAEAIVLCKPQFEAGREQVRAGGVVRDPEVWTTAIEKVSASASAVGWGTGGVVASPLVGPAGNAEFLVHLVADPGADDARDRIAAAVHEAAEREGSA